MKNGDLVKFKNPINEAETQVVMVVKEMRGDRALVESKIWETSNPTNVYLVDDLVLVDKMEQEIKAVIEQAIAEDWFNGMTTSDLQGVCEAKAWDIFKKHSPEVTFAHWSNEFPERYSISDRILNGIYEHAEKTSLHYDPQNRTNDYNSRLEEFDGEKIFTKLVHDGINKL